MRHRVAALIERDGQLLVARQRARGSSGRQDGALYRTPPGGGIEADETPVDAVIREVREEVGLTVTAAVFVARVEYPSGSTEIYEVQVEPGEPVLGVDPEIECECPRLVGLEWVPAPGRHVWNSEEAVHALRAEITDL